MTADGRPILNLWNAEHSFGERKVLRGVDLALKPGEIYGLLGPNGAGKTTLVHAICGRLKLTAGEVSISGLDPWRQSEARAALGLVPQEIALYPNLTVRENLMVFGRLSRVKGEALRQAVDSAMAVTRTTPKAGVRIKHLSGGFQRRVNIAAAILHQPRLLILDEPTVGVDIDAREAVDSVIRDLRDSGVAILMVTHDLDQAGLLSDRIGFLREGRKVLEGAPSALIAQAFGDAMEIQVQLVSEPNAAAVALLEAEGLERKGDGNTWVILDAGGYAAAGVLDHRLRASGLVPREVRVRAPSLQNLFSLVADWRQTP